MNHPLTDEIIRYDKKLGCHDLGTWFYTEDDLRAAYDLAVKNCVNWIYNYESDSLWPPSLEWIAEEIEKVMLPQKNY